MVDASPQPGPPGNLFRPQSVILKNPTTSPSSSSEVLRKFYSFRNLQFEFVRLATFTLWKSRVVKPEDLARTGLFYLQKEDLVQCHFCRGVIAYWEEGDVPSIEHEKHYPNCAFVLKAAVTNVPMDESSPVSVMLKNFILSRMQETEPPPKKKLYQTDSVMVQPAGQRKQQPDEYADYSFLAKRLSTFTNPPPNLPHTQKMAEAGFFLIGLSDMAHCYACGGGLFNWLQTDDPIALHAEHYPECRLVKEHQEETRNKDTAEKATCTRRKLTDEEKRQLLDLSLAKKLLAGGWSPSTVAEGLGHELDTYGTLPADFDEALDVLVDYEEKMGEEGN